MTSRKPRDILIISSPSMAAALARPLSEVENAEIVDLFKDEDGPTIAPHAPPKDKK